MKSLNAKMLFPAQAQLGEGVIWDPRSKCVWWVDINAGLLHRFDPRTEVNDVFDIGQSVSAVALTDTEKLVLTVRNGFAHYDVNNKTLEMIRVIEHENKTIRFNDGKCDPFGRFWAGTLAEDGTPALGSLFCLDIDLSVRKVIEGVGISNGLGWSGGQDKMYYIDSLSHEVREYAYDGVVGDILTSRTVCMIAEEEGTPDGMCVDAEGMLWVALWGGGKVIRVDPRDGSRHCEVIVPNVNKVTSCALGGEGLNTLFITTASTGLTTKELVEQPYAGALFSLEVDTPGVPPRIFGVR